MKNITIIGGGSLGHVIAGFLSAKGKAQVSILTKRTHLWGKNIEVNTVDGQILKGIIHKISSNPEDVIPESDIVLLCLPGFMIRETLLQIKEYLQKRIFVGSVFSSTGFFFEAKELLGEDAVLWGFQRVPFIARVYEYGKSANLLGYKPSYAIAIEHVGQYEKENFRLLIEDWFERPTTLLSSYLEASLTNSTPILHTSRLYAIFKDWKPETTYPRPILFYEEWDKESAEILIKMDREFFQILSVLPVTPNYLPTILDYYESKDAESLARKFSSIQSFKGILSPMKKNKDGWNPDFSSRYFTEDFPYGLRYIRELAHKYYVLVPIIDEVYEWGMNVIKSSALYSDSI